MHHPLEQVIPTPAIAASSTAANAGRMEAIRSSVPRPRSTAERWYALLPVIAVGAALAISLAVPITRQAAPPRIYPLVLKYLVGVTVLPAGLSLARPRLMRFYLRRAPIFAVGILLIAAWELITDKLGWLPSPYFPAPDAILQSFVEDHTLLFESTLHSLSLLLSGYFLGVILGLICGVLIGWYPHVRYWGMPVLKVLGPVPATAWIPLAMALSPSSFLSGVGIISLAVWFPVTMLTASGISNVRLSYLDVARTLGAGRAYLVFRVAIPSALPTMFLGFFMGLGAAFLTLVVAEMLGVKSGLGWYMSWAREFSEYSKVYAALGITAIFFSTIMTVLFLVRDRVLRWQKGVIKW